jgi:hypothetical protein
MKFWLLEIITLTSGPLFFTLFSLRALYVARFIVGFYFKMVPFSICRRVYSLSQERQVVKYIVVI